MNWIPAVNFIFWDRFGHKPSHPHGAVEKSPIREDSVIESQEQETHHVEGDHGEHQVQPVDLDRGHLGDRCRTGADFPAHEL